MSDPTFWWIASVLLLGAELVTGTFFLLMLACGTVAAAISAHLGASVTVQLLVAAMVSVLAVAARIQWRRSRSRMPANATEHPLDIGSTVHVNAWSDTRTATVQYRGAPWHALAADPHMALQTGLHHVVAIRNNQLVLRPVSSSS